MKLERARAIMRPSWRHTSAAWQVRGAVARRGVSISAVTVVSMSVPSLAGSVRSLPGQADLVEARLRELWLTGRAAWPDVPLSDHEFLRYLAERLPETASLPDALDGLNAADLYLAAGCALAHPRALQAFERHCFAALPAALSRYSTSDDFHDEVRQAVRERLFVATPAAKPRIADYAGRGSLAGWVRVVAVRLAIDLLRKRGQQPSTLADDVLQTLATGADPEMRILAERYRDEVKEAFRESFAALSPAERNLLRLTTWTASRSTSWRR